MRTVLPLPCTQGRGDQSGGRSAVTNVMSDQRDQDQEIILDHTKRPRNFRAMADADRTAEGHNRLCGDKLRLFLRVGDGVVRDAAFLGTGCAISTASASILTEWVKGRTVEDAREMFGRFRAAVMSPADAAVDLPALGKMAVFAGVREFPARVKCATLAWHALAAALKNEPAPVSTE